MPAPVKTKPAHITLDRVDVFLLLLGGIGVIKAQVAAAPIVLRDAEVEANRLGVADVQVAVGLGRKARDDRLVPPGLEVGLDDVANEVAAGLALCRRLGVCHVLGIRKLVCRRLSAKSHPVSQAAIAVRYNGGAITKGPPWPPPSQPRSHPWLPAHRLHAHRLRDTSSRAPEGIRS